MIRTCNPVASAKARCQPSGEIWADVTDMSAGFDVRRTRAGSETAGQRRALNRLLCSGSAPFGTRVAAIPWRPSRVPDRSAQFGNGFLRLAHCTLDLVENRSRSCRIARSSVPNPFFPHAHQATARAQLVACERRRVKLGWSVARRSRSLAD
jgi:hypothetical protein